ncbi:MAG TPA: serine/threonine protein kinase [Spirochaetota bacterium]|nr:serine/threonine protein kinase [Spirochaetota bacterium]HPJ33527.1 serine/threonine protein kinase [Spirochaetota bacterium]
MSNLFYTLTPDIVIKAVEENGFTTSGHYMVLNSYENRVYDLRLEEGSHIIVKFYRPGRWTGEQILEEHAFLNELDENEVPVCAPLSFPDGGTLREAEGIFFAVWPRTGGRIPEELSDEELLNLGRLIARIHNNGSAKPAVHRLSLTAESYALKPLEFLIENNFLPDHIRDRYSNAVKEIAGIYSSLAADVPVHRIHGDCHPGNLLKGVNGFFFLDFDDFLTGPAVQDIWMLIQSRDDEGRRQRDMLISGYREFRDFEYSWLQLVEPLRALRYIHYSTWIAKRWLDPAFPGIFPHFGTDRYWEEETADLEDQIEYIYSGGENLPERPGQEGEKEEEKELTNKDFFWDLEE